MKATLKYLAGIAGPSGFGSNSTAEQVTQNCSPFLPSNLTALITGASSGIGGETARVLAKRGVRVVIGARDLKKAREVRDNIQKESPKAEVILLEIDLSSFCSVQRFCSEFLALDLPLNILINNAGIFSQDLEFSEEKIEITFATNYLGHFLLTEILLDKMIETAEKTRIQGRIINVSSVIHSWVKRHGFCFKDILNGKNYNGTQAYAQSKLANILHAKEIARQLKERNARVTINAVHPGIVKTGIIKAHKGLITDSLFFIASKFLKSISQRGTCEKKQFLNGEFLCEGIILMALNMNIKGQIEKVNGKELSYSEFVERYMEKNKPVILTGLMDHHWKASTDWVTPNAQPNFQFFFNHFGSSKVQVADCDTRDFGDQKREEMLVSDFVGRCLQIEGSAVPCSNENGISNGDSLSVPYLKDWHFVKEYPDYVAYITPMFFCDDWLNLYLDNFRMNTYSDSSQQNTEICCSDYRFVYMGIKGSWTPLHADVFRSYSWSANVCGKKRWFFLDPSQHHLVFDRNVKNCVYNIFVEVSDSKYPGFKKAIWLECTQEAGEIIFVPSGWYHQVHNLEDTISINHNWFNAYNLSWVWNLLLRDYNEAKEYIEDIKDICDDFECLCQRNLAANTGMNFYDFFTFISYFSLANLVLLCYINGKDGSTTGSSSRVAQHLYLNIGSIRKVASEMKNLHALEGNHDCIVDMIKTYEDPRFSKFCIQVGKTYLTIHEQSNLFSDFESASTVELADLGVFKAHTSSQVYTPEDLIKFIDTAVAELGDIFIESSVLRVA